MIIYLLCQVKKGQSLFVNAVILAKLETAKHYIFWLGWPKGNLHFNKQGPMWLKHKNITKLEDESVQMEL